MRRRNVRLSCLSFIFGFGSWVGMTGLWLELPIFVQILPEGPNLATNLSVALQAANIFCVIYWIVLKKFPTKKVEEIAIHLMMAVGSISCFLMIFFWSKTLTIFNIALSIPLYILSFGLSIVDTASSITFLPYMARFDDMYLVPFLAGEGMGGFIPSLVSLAQGLGEEECVILNIINSNNASEMVWTPNTPTIRFSEELFLLSLLILVLISWISFATLNHNSFIRKRKVKLTHEVEIEVMMKNEMESTCNKQDLNETEINVPVSQVSQKNYYILMAFQFWASLATFGIFPALQPFSCLPYGASTFHLSVTLSGMAYPLACFISLFIEIRQIKSIALLTTAATVISVYLLMTAILNPYPPLRTSLFGKILLVLSWTLFTGLFSYIKTMITVILSDMGHKVLFNVGAITQVGAFLGSIFMLGLVNLSEIFNDQVCFQ